MADISVVLSKNPIDHSNLVFVDRVGDIYIYRVAERMGGAIQVPLRSPVEFDSRDVVLDPREGSVAVNEGRAGQGSLMEFELAGMKQRSMLVLSQKFYSNWEAQALTAEGWVNTPTVSINGIFQGILLPNDTRRVRLEFVSWATLAWIGQVIWLGMFATLLARISYARMKRFARQLR